MNKTLAFLIALMSLTVMLTCTFLVAFNQLNETVLGYIYIPGLIMTFIAVKIYE